MPTVLNNACINRVFKILKLKLTSNDLTALKTTPYNVLPFKIDGKFVSLKFIDVLVPAGHSYVGDILISCLSPNIGASISYTDSNVNPNLNLTNNFGVNGYYQLSVVDDFDIGDVRPDIELHIYYTIESVSVNYDVGFTEYQN